jgi:hypothetical protein
MIDLFPVRGFPLNVFVVSGLVLNRNMIKDMKSAKAEKG